jgi:hypothetical protein
LHWRFPGDKKRNVFGHQAEDSVNIAHGRSAVPSRDNVTNRLLVASLARVHDAQFAVADLTTKRQLRIGGFG